MHERPCGNGYRTTMVCIDSYAGQIPMGRLYNPYLDGETRFEGLMQLLMALEELLNEMQFPQSFTAPRSFGAFAFPAARKVPAAQSAQPQEGKHGTFALKIFFRQNASWQGSIQWLETGQEESFRSVLELIFLLNSALKRENPTETETAETN